MMDDQVPSRAAFRRHCAVLGLGVLVVSTSSLVTVFSGCKRQTANSPIGVAAEKQETAKEADSESPSRAAATPAETVAADRDDVPDRATQLDRAIELQEREQHEDAAKILRRLIIRDPQDYTSVFHLANSQAALGNLEEAIDLLSGIPESDPDSGLPALGVSADWCLQLGRFDHAMDRYKKILEMAPGFQMARRRLAYLLNRQGRRHEANTLIRELCQAGDVTQDELFSLIVESDAMYDPPGERPASGARPYWPIGPLGEARHLFTNQQYAQAADLIRPSLQSGDATPAAIAFYGLTIAEGQLDEEFQPWLSFVNSETKSFPEYWSAIGIHLIRETKYEAAIGAFAEALRRDPSDHRSVRRMLHGFRSIKATESAEAFRKRFQTINGVVTSANRLAAEKNDGVELFLELADGLQKMGRRLEATLWRSLAAARTPQGGGELQRLNKTLQDLVAGNNAFPDEAERLCGVDFSDFLQPQFKSQNAPTMEHQVTKTDDARLESAAKARFRNVAGEIGLDFVYRVATIEQSKAFSIYQQLGGGVAVLDFDRDGWSDLYFAQGAADPPKFVAQQSDQLYRHLSNPSEHRLLKVTEHAELIENQFTIGVTSGDWNQDGFPDLATSNLGVNRLLINQGDGTFVSRALDESPDPDRCATSLAMGDVTADQLPDLIVLNYLRDAGIAREPKLDANGNVEVALAPLDFQPARDQVYRSQHDGTWNVAELGESADDASTGLGVVLGELDGKPGNDLFIGNDVAPNQFWTQSPGGTFIDQAIARGMAYSSRGLATAAMGIAAADFDHSGTMDFHVTNFADEPVNLFLQQGGLFRDSNIRFQLVPDSMPVVGFGTQPLDYSNDGWPDLVVANGHVDDISHLGIPFRQPPQLFAHLGNRFEPVTVPGDDYWSQLHSGRALATLDFDRNGRQDFVVTDLLSESALLLNESESNHHWVRLQLVGTRNERDAVGAHVTVVAGEQEYSHWVTSGDGYLCKNEMVLHVGLGAADSIDRVEVHWPSGDKETVTDVPVDRTHLLIEGQELYSLE